MGEMSTHRGPRVDRATAEDLLGSGTGGPESLSSLLAAARAPAAKHELTCEPVILAEFRSAHLDLITPPRRTSMLKTTAAKLLTAKLLAGAALATAATGGVALAAATNTLPDAVQGAAHDVFNAPAPSDHGKPSQRPSQGKQSATESSAAPKATPSPSLRGLCTAYQAGATSNNGKALNNPAFSALITAAGGTDKVAAYCTTLIGAPSTHPTGRPSSHPTGKPTAPPTGAHESHPTGEPTTLPTTGHPTGQPTSEPAGPPSTLPSKP
jgi:hypothetical protein